MEGDYFYAPHEEGELAIAKFEDGTFIILETWEDVDLSPQEAHRFRDWLTERLDKCTYVLD